MKFYRLLILLASGCVFFCCSNDSKKETEALNAIVDNDVEDVEETTVTLIDTYQDQVKETFFFFFREERFGLDHHNLIKHESIQIEGESITYTLVTIPSSVARDFTRSKKEANMEASFISLSLNEIEDENYINDTIEYNGILSLVDTITSGNEGTIASLRIQFSGGYSESTFGSNPYSEYERMQVGDGFETELIVDVKNPRIYKSDELYLKARIFNLDRDDLSGYSKEEMAYLRNEIFARHGHTFKTDKMKNYFSQKKWYLPYVNDATESLNEIEKRNAQFIKGMEENS